MREYVILTRSIFFQEKRKYDGCPGRNAQGPAPARMNPFEIKNDCSIVPEISPLHIAVIHIDIDLAITFQPLCNSMEKILTPQIQYSWITNERKNIFFCLSEVYALKTLL